MKVTVLGSNLKADIPKDFNLFFKNGFGYDQRFGKFQEMDPYYLYMLLKAFEYRSIEITSDLKALRKQCFEAAYNRLNDDFEWRHGHWSDKYNETHCRFSSAGIRLLIEQYREHPDEVLKKNIILAAKSLVKLSEKLDTGRWFYHDSLEIDDEKILDYRMKVIKSRLFGKSTHNTLTLNTHIDTLITLFNLKRELDAAEFDREVEDGLAALNYVLKHNKFEFILYPITLLQSIFFKCKSDYFTSRVLKSLLLNISMTAKKIFPSFTLPNGYIIRAHALKNFVFNYHVINLWDLCKLQRYYMNERIKQIIAKGFDFIFETPYINFFIKRDMSGGIEICESILIYLAVNEIFDYTPWIARYLKVRKNYFPSSAIIGYDSIVIPNELRIPYNEFPVLNPELDILNISKSASKYRYVVINPSEAERSISYNMRKKYVYSFYKPNLNNISPPKNIKPNESFILEISPYYGK